MKLLHLIDHIGAGGPFRSLLTFVRRANCTGSGFEHSVVSMETDAYAPLVFDARRLGISVVRGPSRDALDRHVEAADVVLLHFWNTPGMWQFLSRGAPTARYVIWSKVLGVHSPQILSPNLLAGMIRIVLTAQRPEIDGTGRSTVIVPGLADFKRVDGLISKAHVGFNADYIGTCNIGKLHPGFVKMMERIEIPPLAVRICGQPDDALSNSIKSSRDPSRFHMLGFVENIRSILESSDVFVYPLSETTYATSDKSLQEAMLVGIPPVVFPHGGCANFVTDGKTGIVAQTEDEFVSAVEYLHRNPEYRSELGRNARNYANSAFAIEKPVATLTGVLEAAARCAPRDLMENFAPLKADDERDAERFLVSQGWQPADAIDAVSDWLNGDHGSLEQTFASWPDETFQVEGGVLHWRKAIPGNFTLRLWSAAWLIREGRTSDAIAEIEAARRLGAPSAICARLEPSG